MANDLFLDLGGSVRGECKDAVYAGKIDILAWHWGISQTGTAHTGGGGGAGKSSFKNLAIMKYMDASTPNLMQHCAKGTHFPEGKLVVRKAGGEPLEYLIFTMQKILLTHYAVRVSELATQPTEKLTLNFASVNMEYVAQKDDGSGDAGIVFGWDIEANCQA